MRRGKPTESENQDETAEANLGQTVKNKENDSIA